MKIYPIQEWPSCISVRACAQICITRIADFGLFLPKCASFFKRELFSFDRKLLKLAGIDQHRQGRLWTKNSHWLTPITPKFLQFCDLKGPKASSSLQLRTNHFRDTPCVFLLGRKEPGSIWKWRRHFKTRETWDIKSPPPHPSPLYTSINPTTQRSRGTLYPL